MVALLLAAADAGADPQRALSHAVSAYSSLTPIAEATGLDDNQAL